MDDKAEINSLISKEFTKDTLNKGNTNHLGFMLNIDIDSDYILGYLQGAKILAEKAKKESDTNIKNILIYPSWYLLRHTVELLIKNQLRKSTKEEIEEYSLSHLIKKLIPQDNITPKFRDVTKELDQIDKNGQIARYPDKIIEQGWFNYNVLMDYIGIVEAQIEVFKQAN